MQQLSMQMQQLQRHFGQLCQEMIGLQSAMNQIAAQIQSAEGTAPGIPVYRGRDGGAPVLPSGPPVHSRPGGSVQPQASPYGSDSGSPYGRTGPVGMTSTTQNVTGQVSGPTYSAVSFSSSVPGAASLHKTEAGLTANSQTSNTMPASIPAQMPSSTTASVGRQSEHTAYGRDFQS